MKKTNENNRKKFTLTQREIAKEFGDACAEKFGELRDDCEMLFSRLEICMRRFDDNVRPSVEAAQSLKNHLIEALALVGGYPKWDSEKEEYWGK